MSGEPSSLPSFTMADYNLYRTDEGVFWVLIAAALTFCIVHAARRAFRQPQATGIQQADSFQDEEIARHSLFQRIFHWANSAAIFTLLFSGLMIYRLREISVLQGTPSEWFFWHRWGIALLLVGIAAHLIHEAFVAKEANPMVVNRTEMRRIRSIFGNFFGVSKEYPLAGKYHTGQIFFHWAVAGNIFLLILSGMILWKPFRELLPLSIFHLGWDFIYWNRLGHGLFSATLIASLIGHLYFALMIQKNWPETKSMVTGRISRRKYLESHAPED